MIFQPQSDTDATTDVQAPQLAQTVYLMGLERAWEQYIEAERTHPVYAPRRAGIAYKGYASLAEYMAALNAQNAVIAEALVVLQDIRERLYGNKWGN